MAEQLSKWEERRRRLIEPLLKRTDFQEDVHRIREELKEFWVDNADEKQYREFINKLLMRCRGLVVKYGLPQRQRFEYFIQAYIGSGETKYELFRTGIQVISMEQKAAFPAVSPVNDYGNYARAIKRGEGTYISIPKGVTRQELEEFISLNWAEIIEPLVGAEVLGRKRVRETLYTDRDEAIYQMAVDGLSPQEIASAIEVEGINGRHYDLTPEYVRKIISRTKHKHDA